MFEIINQAGKYNYIIEWFPSAVRMREKLGQVQVHYESFFNDHRY